MQLATRNNVVFAAAMASLVLSGCATNSLSVARENQTLHSVVNAEDGSGVDIRYGRPNRLLDGTGWVLGIPRKILLWDRRVDNHAVGPETSEWIEQYANSRQLDGLCVRVNEYDPVDEFRRLKANQSIAPGWRYTVGSMRVVKYALVPGRLFGGDDYNPFTNSVYVYSDVPALAVEAAAYAEDVQNRKWPGTYAAINELPVVSIWHETVNSRDAVVFVEQYGAEDQQNDSLRILHSNYGSTVAVAIGAGPIAQVGAAIAGQATGAIHAARLQKSGNSDVAADSAAETDEQHVHLVSATSVVDR